MAAETRSEHVLEGVEDAEGQRTTELSSMWAGFRQLVAGQNIPSIAREWMVRRALHFVGHRSIDDLRRITPEHVSCYFDEVLLRFDLKPWQVTQAVDAVALLCGSILKLEWAGRFAWQRWRSAPSCGSPGRGRGVLSATRVHGGWTLHRMVLGTNHEKLGEIFQEPFLEMFQEPFLEMLRENPGTFPATLPETV